MRIINVNEKQFVTSDDSMLARDLIDAVMAFSKDYRIYGNENLSNSRFRVVSYNAATSGNKKIYQNDECVDLMAGDLYLIIPYIEKSNKTFPPPERTDIVGPPLI